MIDGSAVDIIKPILTPGKWSSHRFSWKLGQKNYFTVYKKSLLSVITLFLSYYIVKLYSLIDPNLWVQLETTERAHAQNV